MGAGVLERRRIRKNLASGARCRVKNVGRDHHDARAKIEWLPHGAFYNNATVDDFVASFFI